MSNSDTMWPLTEDAKENFIIAGKPVAYYREQRITSDLTVQEHVWLTREDITRLSDATHATLADSSGNLLASIGNGSEKITAKSSFLIKYPWQIITLAEDIFAEMTSDSIEGDVHANAVVEGKLQLGKGTRILPGVYIEGNVTIGEHCKIGPNCYIRGNTSIGNNCHIGQSVEVKNSIIGNNTNVGHLAYVGDSVIGDNANFGAGTITSNFRHDGSNHRSVVQGEVLDTGRRKFGTIIGDGVHTGINTSIYPGRKIGANCSTLPAAVVQKDIHS